MEPAYRDCGPACSGCSGPPDNVPETPFETLSTIIAGASFRFQRKLDRLDRMTGDKLTADHYVIDRFAARNIPAHCGEHRLVGETGASEGRLHPADEPYHLRIPPSLPGKIDSDVAGPFRYSEVYCID
jgi:hypothetical protein